MAGRLAGWKLVLLAGVGEVGFAREGFGAYFCGSPGTVSYSVPHGGVVMANVALNHGR
jgi:hypothetical protein